MDSFDEIPERYTFIVWPQDEAPMQSCVRIHIETCDDNHPFKSWMPWLITVDNFKETYPATGNIYVSPFDVEKTVKELMNRGYTQEYINKSR